MRCSPSAVGAVCGVRTPLGLAALLLALPAVHGCGRDELILAIDPNSGTDTFAIDTDTDATETGPGQCGDAIVDIDESCDDGNTNDQDDCTNSCNWAECGDGILWLGFEECDPGAENIGPNEACVPGCFFNVCGDGNLGPGEGCDDGNLIEGDGCNSDCSPGSCGDRITDPFEQCDDGNFDNSDDCLDTCVFASCGDQFIQMGVEECDDGGLNSDAADCTSDCTVNFCGDAKQHASDEECDPGAPLIGPGMACLTGCVLSGCGDGLPGPGEGCDDGNADDTDDCLSTCELATCGDGFVNALSEQCDDTNSNDDDACHNDCTRTEVVQIRPGGNHTCALLDHGKLMCWGNGDDGRTGYASEENLGDDEPAGTKGFVDVAGALLEVRAGLSHSCGLLSGGVRCWGRASDGQLGQGNTTTIGDDELPSTIGFVDLGGVVESIATGSGGFHTCAIRDDGSVICWGGSGFGRLGYAAGVNEQDVGDDETPGEWVATFGAVDVSGPALQVVTGFEHSCALLVDGSVRCWGNASSGQLGYGNANAIGDNETPASAGPVSLGGTAIQISAGWYHTCALLDTNQIKCWGRGNDGRLGYGSTAWVGLLDLPTAVGFVDVGGTPVEVRADFAHTCARLDDGTMVCWGYGGRGQLGYGNVTNIGDNETPASAGPVPVGAPVVGIDLGYTNTCAILDDGRVKCWGDAGEGRLGYGNLDWIGDDETPASVGPVPVF